MALAGHTLLAQLGKRRLRPGGIKATNWLLQHADFNHKKALEVACNQGTTSIELARKYDVDLHAVDLDREALKKAEIAAAKKQVRHKIDFVVADALALPYEKETFDYVLNEAMLTMLSDEHKELALKEYQRVLKTNGTVLTHDVCLFTDDQDLTKEIVQSLSRAIKVHVRPKTVKEWYALFEQNGYRNITVLSGKMSLMNPIGMIRDEGLFTTIKIFKNSRKHEHYEQFKAMYQTFKKYKKYLGFIAVAAQK